VKLLEAAGELMRSVDQSNENVNPGASIDRMSSPASSFSK
jgi:hypothetical protein